MFVIAVAMALTVTRSVLLPSWASPLALAERESYFACTSDFILRTKRCPDSNQYPKNSAHGHDVKN
jgi:hypothetical protein